MRWIEDYFSYFCQPIVDEYCSTIKQRKMFRIPVITKNLLIINLLFFVASWVFEARGVYLSSIGGLHFFLAPDFALYQFVTYQFLHSGFTHLFFNMFALWMFGGVIENVWGPRRFLFYYLVCGIFAGLMQEGAQLVHFMLVLQDSNPFIGLMQALEVAHVYGGELNTWTTIGASGAVYSVLLAFGMLFPDNRIFIFPLPVPIKAKWFVCLYIVVELFSALATTNDSVAHFAHLGGMLFGWLMIRYWRNQSGGGYGSGMGGGRFFEHMKRNWEQRTGRKADDMNRRDNGNRSESDWDYNAHRKQREEEIDRILDKVRKSGYDSLTEEEKRKLFDGGK